MDIKRELMWFAVKFIALIKICWSNFNLVDNVSNLTLQDVWPDPGGGEKQFSRLAVDSEFVDIVLVLSELLLPYHVEYEHSLFCVIVSFGKKS